MARTKHVMPTAMVAHLWANPNTREVHDAHNASNSASFVGRYFYSYKTPIAHIVRSPRGVAVALVSSVGYSITTKSKHLSAVQHALHQSDVATFTVPYICTEPCGQYRALTLKSPSTDCLVSEVQQKREAQMHEANLAYLLSCYGEAFDRFMRQPSNPEMLRTTYGVQVTLERLESLACQYAILFGVPFARPNSAADAEFIMARFHRLQNSPAAVARQKANVAKAARQAIADAARQEGRDKYEREMFRCGNTSLRVSDEEHGAMLRLSSDRKWVETSWGANAPVDDVANVIDFYCRVRASHPNKAFDAQYIGFEGLARKLGHFKLDAINANGSVKVGCHTINAPEIELLRQCMVAEGIL